MLSESNDTSLSVHLCNADMIFCSGFLLRAGNVRGYPRSYIKKRKSDITLSI